MERIRDPEVVATLFHPRVDLSEDVKRRLIKMIADTGAILKGHFVVEDS